MEAQDQFEKQLGQNRDQRTGSENLSSVQTNDTTLSNDPAVRKMKTEEPSKKTTARLDNYTILHNLGEGAYGSVNLAIDKTTQKQVAIKAVNIMKICELNKERHILREKELLDSLRKHHCIIQLMGTFKDNKNLYFVFECAKNGTLDDLIRQLITSKFKGLGLEAIKLIFAQLVNFMELMQQEGIMHRDLKPQNIMMDDNYNIKIIDFGDARKVDEVIEEDQDEQPEDDSDPQANIQAAMGNASRERQDTFVGTVNYQSPEVIQGEPQGLAVDTWALGNILFKMFVGTVPFKGANPITVYRDIKARKISWPDEQKMQEIFTPEAVDLINRMIQIEPTARLGHNLESTQQLKQHPFFKGVDWVAISSKKYTGIYDLLSPKVDELNKLKQQEEEEKYSGEYYSDLQAGRNTMLKNIDMNLYDQNQILIKGNLIKKNWFGNKQMRFFELYGNGDLKYFQDMKDFKGCIFIGPSSRVVKTSRTTITLYSCDNQKNKSKDYVLMQPDTVNFAQDKAKGHQSQIDAWLKEINTLVEILKQKQDAAKDLAQQ